MINAVELAGGVDTCEMLWMGVPVSHVGIEVETGPVVRRKGKKD